MASHALWWIRPPSTVLAYCGPSLKRAKVTPQVCWWMSLRSRRFPLHREQMRYTPTPSGLFSTSLSASTLSSPPANETTELQQPEVFSRAAASSRRCSARDAPPVIRTRTSTAEGFAASRTRGRSFRSTAPRTASPGSVIVPSTGWVPGRRSAVLSPVDRQVSMVARFADGSPDGASARQSTCACAWPTSNTCAVRVIVATRTGSRVMSLLPGGRLSGGRRGLRGHRAGGRPGTRARRRRERGGRGRPRRPRRALRRP